MQTQIRFVINACMAAMTLGTKKHSPLALCTLAIASGGTIDY